MKQAKQNKKSGFTLVELMVVAIIVAILAAVAIPLITGNKDKAMATEAQNACGTIATQYKVYYALNDAAPTKIADITTINDGALAGTYFAHADYKLTTATDENDFVITATSSLDSGAKGKTVVMTVKDGATTWSGTLLGN